MIVATCLSVENYIRYGIFRVSQIDSQASLGPDPTTLLLYQDTKSNRELMGLYIDERGTIYASIRAIAGFNTYYFYEISVVDVANSLAINNFNI
jgi:hypothetical protein